MSKFYHKRFKTEGMDYDKIILMKILGIESSCDETAASIVVDGTTVLSNVVNSQIEIHSKFGGVIPEVAARSHLEVINPVIEQALSDANLGWNDIDAIAVTYAPGLIGSLLIGSLAARTLAITKNIPLYGVHHVLAHFYANFLGKPEPKFPCLALIVSGGHTQLVLFESHDNFTLLGKTKDDAVGEAFDKVAKIIGLPYPGGPSIAKTALTGNPNRFKFPKPKTEKPLDFSYSGLKTAVLRQSQKQIGKDHTFPSFQIASKLTDNDRRDLASSFQETAIQILVDKTKLAYETYLPNSIVIAGGVAANSLLRQKLTEQLPIAITYPEPRYCTDNAAMIASAGYYRSKNFRPTDPFTLEVIPSLSIDNIA